MQAMYGQEQITPATRSTSIDDSRGGSRLPFGFTLPASHPKVPCSPLSLTGDSMSAPDHTPSNLTREDVHKSCKSLETVVNLLNGYCEAASTTVILQKKLVKAIRDTAAMKASPTVASNHIPRQSFALSSPHPGQTVHLVLQQPFLR